MKKIIFGTLGLALVGVALGCSPTEQNDKPTVEPVAAVYSETISADDLAFIDEHGVTDEDIAAEAAEAAEAAREEGFD